jgi:hypothetical protein
MSRADQFLHSVNRIANALEILVQRTGNHFVTSTDRLERPIPAAPGSVADLSSFQDDLHRLAVGVERIADAIAPRPEDIVGTPYVAKRLGCTKVWIAEMVRNGQLPKSCLVTGTGNGKPWKFHREAIEKWLASR